MESAALDQWRSERGDRTADLIAIAHALRQRGQHLTAQSRMATLTAEALITEARRCRAARRTLRT
jgi:hypothetical protein